MKCPECGTDDYVQKYYDKLCNEQLEVSKRFKDMRAHHGLREAEWELKEISLVESMKSLQRKTQKQSKVINRLEEKLRALRQQPYKEDLGELL